MVRDRKNGKGPLGDRLSEEELAARLLSNYKKQREAGQNAPHARKHATKAASKQAQVRAQAIWHRKADRNDKEIGREVTHNLPNFKEGEDIFSKINWPRRLACQKSLLLYCETYLRPVFYYGWSDDQRICVSKAERISRDGGMFSVAMPRGGGKTAICRAATIWAADYAYKHFIYNIGSTEPKSTQTLGFVKVQHAHNPLLLEDFPEICWPIIRYEGTNRLAGGQTFCDQPTFGHWGEEYVRFPTLLFPREILAPANWRPVLHPANKVQSDVPQPWLNDLTAKQVDALYEQYAPRSGETLVEWYLRCDEGSIKEISHLQRFAPANAGTLLRASGIDGSIRGEAEADPITLEQPRPDLVILDDVQKDAKADSPLLTDKLIRLIEGAVAGLAGPGRHIDALMPCTVIREGDAADIFLDPLQKPDWQGERCQMVKSWPEGVTDFEITTDTKAGELWNKYAELRRTSIRDDNGSFQQATDLYQKHRKVMDKGFVVSWEERYDRRTEISAQQHAMNLRLKLGPMFLPEYQNIGRRLIETAEILITAKQLAVKQVDFKRGHMAPGHNFVVTHIDVQNEILYWVTFATDADFNGTFIDYGTWPEVKIPYFTKAQTESWSLLTTEFFRAYPQHKSKAIKASSGKVRAPLEAKIYHALSQAVPYLLQKEYRRQDSTARSFKTMRLGIDTRWGQASEAIKRFIRESGHQHIVPYYGQAMPPTHKQFEEYELREGWLFEQQLNPLVREPKWLMRPNPDGFWYMQADVNRLKDFLFSRLSVPLGAPGCVSVHTAPAEYHELFVNHLCSSEYPEPVSARGITKNQWTKREGTAYDNDYLDCAAACMALASTLGVSLKTSDFSVQPIRRRLSEIREKKRQRKAS